MKKVNACRPSAAQQTLRFSPYAWAKLLYLRDLGPTEIGAFGISHVADLLHVQDVVLVRQKCTSFNVLFADDSVADYFDRQVDAGRKPQEFARIWIHTHPGESALPSAVDEETFARVFGRCDWSVMCIVARGGASYARLDFTAGPTGSQRLGVEIDYSLPFLGSAIGAWEDEYHSHVEVDQQRAIPPFNSVGEDGLAFDDRWLDEFDVEFLEALSDGCR